MTVPAATPDDMTLGELHRTILAVQSNMNERFAETNERVQGFASAHVRADVYQAEQAHVHERITGLGKDIVSIEDGLRWFRRYVIGALVTVVASGIAAFIFTASH